MAARRALFKQADVTRALRGAHAAGIENVRVEIEPDGRMTIVTGTAAAAAVRRNSFDELLAGQ